MSEPVVLAIDQGTSSVRATVVRADMSPIAAKAEQVERRFPRPSWVELDAAEVVRATERVAVAALGLANRVASEVVAVGLANQGETVVVWDRRTGEPIAPAVGWQCRRTDDECARLREDARASWVTAATGLPIDAYFSATKLAWILDHVPGARARAERGDLAAGTLDTFTLWRLSGGRLFVTDPSTACRTLLADLATGRFDERLCELFRVPLGLLPEVVSSDACLGPIRLAGGEVAVRAILCDQPSALLGTGCLEPGDAKCTYGTGAFVQVNTGTSHLAGDDGLLRSIAWELGGERTYLLEGSVLSAGDVLTWLRDGLGILADAAHVEQVLSSTPDASGVSFVPALTGLGAPRSVGEARGMALGLHRGTRREHLVRAALESIAHQVADVLCVAERIVPGGLRPMWADGGLSASASFLALQADLSGHPLRRAAYGEATTRGVAALAAVGAGLAPSVSALMATEPEVSFAPSLAPSLRENARRKHRALLDLVIRPDVIELGRP